jgi:hypothetical protein
MKSVYVIKNEGILTIYNKKPERVLSYDSIDPWRDNTKSWKWDGPLECDGYKSYRYIEKFTIPCPSEFLDMEENTPIEAGVEMCDVGYLYLARSEFDKDFNEVYGDLDLFKNKPFRTSMTLYPTGHPEKAKTTSGFWDDYDDNNNPTNEYFELDEDMFPDLKWEDEPRKAKLKRL